MQVKRFFLSSIFVMFAIEAAFAISAQNTVSIAKQNMKEKDMDIVLSEILSCPAWDKIERGNDVMKNKLMECLALIARNEVGKVREAIAILLKKHPQDSSAWSKTFLINRYLFRVPDKSPIDNNLFGGWAGVSIENGMVNRLWPFSYNSQGKLQLVGEFEGYYGNEYRGIDEFDYFQKKFGLRKQ